MLPLAVWSDDAVLLHNVARLLTFVFSGLTAFWLARELGAGEGAALLAGAVFAFSPIRTDQIAHLSTLGTHWLPLVVLYAVRFARTGRPAHALLSALFFVLTFHACGYHGVIALAVLPPAFVVLLWGQWRRLGTAVLAGALAGAALVPLYLCIARPSSRSGTSGGPTRQRITRPRSSPFSPRARGTGSTATPPTPSGRSVPTTCFPASCSRASP